MDCGDQGDCSEGKCVCKNGFTGDKCEIDNSVYGEWSDFGKCAFRDQICGPGIKKRTRACTGFCDKDLEEFEECDIGPCAEYGEWSKWLGCSITCGGGEQ